MEARSQPARDQTVTFGSYTPKHGMTTRSRLRFFAHRRRLLWQHLGDNLNDVAKLCVERIIRSEWELTLLDRRLDRGEKLSADELRNRTAMDARLRSDLSKLMPKQRAAPVAPKSAPAPKTEPPEKAQSLDEYLASKRAEAPVP